MPGDEPQANTSEVASTSSSTVTTEVQPLLPVGLAMPKPLKTQGNLTSNWKKFNVFILHRGRSHGNFRRLVMGHYHAYSAFPLEGAGLILVPAKKMLF